MSLLTRPVLGSTSRTDLVDEAIPSDWIASGSPRAKALNLYRTTDQGFASYLWECSAGSFRWHCRHDEVFLILKGEVIVTEGTGDRRTLVAGDYCIVEAGDLLHFEIPVFVRKMTVTRSRPPMPFRKRIRRKTEQARALAKKLFGA